MQNRQFMWDPIYTYINIFINSFKILIIKANEMHIFPNLFDKILCMFRTGRLSIIRSVSTLYTRNRLADSQHN